MVKFFGLPDPKAFGQKDNQPKVIDDQVSYLALMELVGRVINSGVYSDKPKGLDGKPATLETLTADLPQTWPVSENSSAQVIDNYQGKAYLRLKQGRWLEYKQ